eukprot:2288092-Ditylum_brightwellii.AAC.1
MPTLLKQQAVTKNAQKNGENGKEDFIDSWSCGYDTQSRYQSGSVCSGGSDYATDYHSCLDYVDMDNPNGDSLDLASTDAAETAKERAERSTRQQKRQEASGKWGKLNENTESC